MGWPANWNAGRTSSSKDAKTRSLMETLLTRRTWMEILPAVNAGRQDAEEGFFGDNSYL